MIEYFILIVWLFKQVLSNKDAKGKICDYFGSAFGSESKLPRQADHKVKKNCCLDAC